MFRFDFRDKSLIPPILGTDNADYLERLMPVLERERIHPSGVVRLRDAAFCEERGIVQLSSSAEHTALLENDDYKRLGHRFGMDGDVIRNGTGRFSYLHSSGIRTEGVAAGKNGQRGQGIGRVSERFDRTLFRRETKAGGIEIP